jgi:SagB-type dehydrogenase family enzyme
VEVRGHGAWTWKLAEALALPWAGESPLIIGLSSIFWRESWKYGERAYRYCCHDLGHAVMSLLLAARGLGLHGGAVAHFGDARLARALGIAGSDEAPMAFLIFPSLRATLGRATPFESGARFESVAEGKPNELSEREVSYELLLGIHAASCLPDTPGTPPLLSAIDPVAAAAPEHRAQPQHDLPLAKVVRRRRSALDFDAATAPMQREDLVRLLAFATRDWRADWRGNFSGDGPLQSSRKDVDLVDLYLYVHRVEGCDPGVYLWDSRGRELRQLHSGNVQRVAAFLSLEQPLAGNSCFSISMIADLDRAARAFGNRGYRYAFFEAGAIGQRLYVGAESLGWNATGIGAFYDDDVHRYLGFLEERDSGNLDAAVREAEKSSLVMLGSPASRAAAEARHIESAIFPKRAEPQAKNLSVASPAGEDSLRLPRQVIYHFAVGRAVPDPRLEA